MMRDRHFWLVVAAGVLLGGLGVLLAVWGNPENSGICVSCFIENSAGALGFHDNSRMQYLRPELIGFVLGSAASAILFREFRSRGGSAPLPRLFAGIFMMVGCAVFIGCPIKLFLRLTAGDLTALAGVAGLVAGVWAGVRSLANGVEPGPPEQKGRGEGLLVPVGFIVMLAFLFVQPGFLLFSGRGSAAQHAPLLISLAAGLSLGVAAQRSRFCITGSIRDIMLMGRRSYMLWGFMAFLVAAAGFNLASGRFNPGYYGQPGAHLDALWSFLGMGLTGWISVLIGGCPFRQLIKAGEGDGDAGLVVVGMFIGGALVQSWGVAATAAGVPLSGKIAVLAGFAFVLAGCLLFRERSA
ncbi:YedE family putative selenium transporter [Geobacter sp. AOG1]|uniref:YedE family putative selenium transporter n=1 Tax=Geobacter sp. AOG1 TaxID=1566346 RepID=UPI001CC3CF92|nr:YedE family putative selenium transporter [Geobacter sp. AOG1]GFE56419.1 membrane protein [Geobacter sp. AOG1]